jgi:hypothetical protein
MSHSTCEPCCPCLPRLGIGSTVCTVELVTLTLPPEHASYYHVTPGSHQTTSILRYLITFSLICNDLSIQTVNYFTFLIAPPSFKLSAFLFRRCPYFSLNMPQPFQDDPSSSYSISNPCTSLITQQNKTVDSPKERSEILNFLVLSLSSL